MSEDWEVVGKQKKQRKTGERKSQSSEKVIPKIEDVLSNSQIKSLISSYDDIYVSQDKENKSNNLVTTTTVNKIANGEGGKKPGTPVKTSKPNKQNDKPAKVPSKPKFKDLDTALKAISADNLQSNLETVNANFKDNHLMLLKAVTSFLNEHLRVIDTTDPIFINKPLVYPNNIIPQPLKKLIIDVIKMSGLQNIQHCFDLTLSNLAEDMNKNLPYLGHKIMLQVMATEYPSICVNSLARNAILRNSYQNRSNIGLSILWAMGQGGFRDLNVGLKVWQDIMVPVIDLKTYSKYVYEYIHKILFKHKTTKLNITSSDFLTILNSLTIIKKVSKELQKLLDETAAMLVERYVQSSPSTTNTFTSLFKNLPFITKPEFVYNGLIQCIVIDPECLDSWKNIYKQNVPQSVSLLSHVDKLSDDLTCKFANVTAIKPFLNEISEMNEELGQGKKKVDGLKASKIAIQQVQEKVSSKKNKSSKSSKSTSSSFCCKFVCGTFLLIAAIGGLIGYDTYRHGGKFEASQTGQLLKQTGALPYVQDGWTFSMKHSARGYKWAEVNGPIYYQQTCKTVGPYVEFSKDFSKILWNGAKKGVKNAKELIAQKTPQVVDFIEQYAPGVPKKVADMICSTWTSVSTISVQSYKNSCDFLKTRVFVGQLSPENLGKALNSTQQAAAQYYSWFHDKVDFYAKIK